MRHPRATVSVIVLTLIALVVLVVIGVLTPVSLGLVTLWFGLIGYVAWWILEFCDNYNMGSLAIIVWLSLLVSTNMWALYAKDPSAIELAELIGIFIVLMSLVLSLTGAQSGKISMAIASACILVIPIYVFVVALG